MTTVPDPQDLETTANLLGDGTDHPPPAPGARFGGYLLIEKIGQGGMGIVYKAQQEAVGRLVALKIMRNRQSGAEEVKRFTNEARAIARLVHPSIVRIHDVGQVDQWHYLACELIHGRSLDQISAGQPMAPDRALEIVAKLAEALDYAHQKGVIHRDLKPSNVLIDAKGAPHLTDFGLARRTDVESGRLTQTGQVVGSPAYMSPEQVSDEFGPIAVTTDVHGLGTILYELLTGRPPFGGENMLKTLHQVLYRLPPAPHALCPEVPTTHSQLCLTCLAKQPAERPPNARAVAIHCRGLLAGLVPTTPAQPHPASPSVDRPGDALEAPPTPPPAAPSSLRPLLILLCLLAGGNGVHLMIQAYSPRVDPPYFERPAPPPDLIPYYIWAVERDDQPAALEILGRHLDRHPRDWKMRSHRIELAHQLNRMLEVFPDLKALDSAGELSSLETEMLLEIYRKQGEHQQASKLMQRVVRRNPELASRLVLEQARQRLAAGQPVAAARTWLQAPPGKAPDGVFLGTLERELRDRLDDPRKPTLADLPQLLRDLFQRDPRFFHWPSLADWFSEDPRRIQPLTTQLLQKLLAESSRNRNRDALGQAAGEALRARDPLRASSLTQHVSSQAGQAVLSGHYLAGLQHYTHCIFLSSSSSSLRFRWQRAGVYSDLGLTARTLVDLAEILRLQPDNLQALGLSARIRLDRQRHQQTILELTVEIDKGAAGNPRLPQLLGNRGFAHLLSYKQKLARSDFEQALQGKTRLVWSLGLALSSTANGDAASRTVLTQLLLRGAGRSLASFSADPYLLKIATRLIALLPDHPLAHAERGNLQIRLGNRATALRDLRRARDLCQAKQTQHGPAIKLALTRARALPPRKKQ